MLSGEGNENGERTTIGLISKKKKNFARAAHFSCIFICRCFARQQSETSKNVVVTLLWRKCRTSHVLVHFFFNAAHFFLGDRQHFSFPHRGYKFILFQFQQKNGSIPLALALRRSFSLFLCLCLSLYSKFVDMTINLS